MSGARMTGSAKLVTIYKHFNDDNYYMRKGYGFTLIELLVVILVLSTVGTIVVAILVSSLRGAAKTNAILEARQNGNYVMSLMSRMIRNARATDVVSCDDPSDKERERLNKLTIENPDFGKTTFECLPPQIASNGANLLAPSVVASDCQIYCDRKTPPNITIKFTITSSVETAEPFSLPFETSISPRNY